MKVGLNLYSIRDFIQTEAKFLSTAEKLKEMGYDYLQYSGASLDAERIARVSKESGLPVYLTHSPMDRILNDTQKLMDEHVKFGCKNIGLGAMSPAIVANESECKALVEKLDRAAEVMYQNGFQFFYHNHHFEFLKYPNGETVFEYLLKNTKYFHFIADTYWVQYGGVNVLSFLEKLKGRVGCVHLKDYQIATKKEGENVSFFPQFCPVGEGNMDFRAIVSKLSTLGTQYYFVEQDDAVAYPDPFGEVERSVKYIKSQLKDL